MFEEYLQDAYEFFCEASKAATAGNNRVARRYYRASVFYASGAIESFINYIASSFELAGTLEPHEVAFLNDKTIVFPSDKLKVMERNDYHRMEDKLRLLIRKFVKNYHLDKEESWSQLLEFKDLRDALVHPRKDDDDTSNEEYEKKIRRGLRAILTIMNALSEGLFKRSIRKQLLDLIPD